MIPTTQQRTWTDVGQIWTDGQRERLAEIFEGLDWQALPATMSFMAGHAIKAAIAQLRLPRVSHVAESNELAPYGLIGIRAHYANGSAQIYLIDTGDEFVPLCSDFEPK